jgi:hypothetical protein
VSAATLLAGFLAGVLVGVPVVQAAVCKVVNPGCNGGLDTTKTAAAHAQYHLYLGGADDIIEPTGVTSWSIVSFWNTNVAVCQETTQTATVDVSWNSGTGQFVLSNESTTTNILDIDICQTDICGSTHGWGYTLIVDITDPIILATYNLRQVVFTTTSVPDGNLLDSCSSVVRSESPTGQTFAGTDNVWNCAFNCDAGAVQIDLTY